MDLPVYNKRKMQKEKKRKKKRLLGLDDTVYTCFRIVNIIFVTYMSMEISLFIFTNRYHSVCWISYSKCEGFLRFAHLVQVSFAFDSI